MDVPAGVTQEEGHTGFLHLPIAVLERRVQPSLSLLNREVVLFYPRVYRSPLVGHDFFHYFEEKFQLAVVVEKRSAWGVCVVRNKTIWFCDLKPRFGAPTSPDGGYLYNRSDSAVVPQLICANSNVLFISAVNAPPQSSKQINQKRSSSYQQTGTNGSAVFTFSPQTGGCSEGLDAFRLFFNQVKSVSQTQVNNRGFNSRHLTWWSC